MSFFRKGVSKICGQQDFFSTLASIPGEPTIVVAHSLGAQVPGAMMRPGPTFSWGPVD